MGHLKKRRGLRSGAVFRCMEANYIHYKMINIFLCSNGRLCLVATELSFELMTGSQDSNVFRWSSQRARDSWGESFVISFVFLRLLPLNLTA